MGEVSALVAFVAVFLAVLTWAFKTDPARKRRIAEKARLEKLAKRKAALARIERDMPDYVKERLERAKRRAARDFRPFEE